MGCATEGVAVTPLCRMAWLVEHLLCLGDEEITDAD